MDWFCSDRLTYDEPEQHELGRGQPGIGKLGKTHQPV
jgi:hypothetical protein